MDLETLILAKSYVNQTLVGMGALAGAPMQLEKIEEIGGGHRWFLLWKDNEGEEHRTTTDVMDGITPLMYMGSPSVELIQRDLKVGDTFPVIKEKFNRELKDEELFFTYLTTSRNGVIRLYAASAKYDEANSQAIVVERNEIAATGLDALTAHQALDVSLLTSIPFEVDAETFNRSPDGAAETCIVFDKFGVYRTVSISAGSTPDKLLITPLDEPVNINTGSVRFEYVQGTPAEEWHIQHNLSYQYPTVSLFDDEDYEINGDIEYYSQNLMIVHFGVPVAGRAYLSK